MPDAKTVYWMGRLSNQDLLWCLRFSSMPRRAVRRLGARSVRRELREAVNCYCTCPCPSPQWGDGGPQGVRAFAPSEQALATKWGATFRRSELLLFDRTRRAHWLTEAKDLDHPIAVLAVGWRREPDRRQAHEHSGDTQ